MRAVCWVYALSTLLTPLRPWIRRINSQNKHSFLGHTSIRRFLVYTCTPHFKTAQWSAPVPSLSVSCDKQHHCLQNDQGLKVNPLTPKQKVIAYIGWFWVLTRFSYTEIHTDPHWTPVSLTSVTPVSLTTNSLCQCPTVRHAVNTPWKGISSLGHECL